jgi:membrane-associated phospholipid phosphatase
LCVLWGPLVCLAVVATGNHYVFDIAAGLVVSAVGYLVGPLPARLLNARRPVVAPFLRPEAATS